MKIENEVWDKLDEENGKSWYAFTVYRDMGYQRSMTKTLEVLGKPESYLNMLKIWSVKYSWVTRAGAYDRHLDQIKQIAVQTEIEDMIKRHTNIIRGMLTKGLSKLVKMSEDDLDPKEVRMFLTEGMKYERLTLGEPTERIYQKQQAEIDVLSDKMTDKERIQYIKTRLEQFKIASAKKWQKQKV